MPDSSDQDPGALQARLAALEGEVEALRQALEALKESKTRFISVVSHELRVPLTSIKGYTDLLRQEAVGEFNPQQHAFLDVIAGNAERMSGLIAGLVDLTRLEDGELRLELTAVSPRSAIQLAARRVDNLLSEKRQDLSLLLAEALPPVTANEVRLTEVLAILLDNASRYSPEESGITLSASDDGAHLRIEVSDQGFGVSPEDLEDVFDPFFRSEDSRVREQQGWGLGLSLAKGLVNQMGGAMGAASDPEAGSTFWVLLAKA